METEVVRAMMLLRAAHPGPGNGSRRAGARGGGAGEPGPDRFLAPEVETASRPLAGGELRRRAEEVTGPLQ